MYTQNKKKMNIALINLFIVLGISFMYCTNPKGNLAGVDFFERSSLGSENDTLFYAATSDTFFQMPATRYDSSLLFVGQQNGIHAKSLVLFSGLPSDGVVDSAKVTLHINRMIGSFENSVSLFVYRIAQSWNESEITWEMADGGFIGDEIASVSIQSNEIDSLSFFIPSDFIYSWMDSSSGNQNFGILLTTDAEEGIIEFHSDNSTEGSSLLPLLTLFMKEDTSQTQVTINPSSDTFISYASVDPRSDRLFLTNGISLRSFLYFDVSQIPAEATINRALLILHCDTTLSVPTPSESFGVTVFSTTGDVSQIPSIPFDSTYFVSDTTQKDSLKLNMTSLLQDWTSGNKTNLGLLLAGYKANIDPYQIGFFSTNSDPILRPRLEVFYSLPSSSQF